MSTPTAVKYSYTDNSESEFWGDQLTVKTGYIKLGGQQVKKIILDGNTIFDILPPPWPDHWNDKYKGTAQIQYYGNYTFTITFITSGSTVSATITPSTIQAQSVTITGNHFYIATTGYAYSSSYTVTSLSGDYDAATDTYINVRATGNAESMLLNNGQIVMTRYAYPPTPTPTSPVVTHKLVLNMDQPTDAKYRQLFKRRLRVGDDWETDSTGAGITRDTSHYASGTSAVKIQGSSSYPVSISFQNDWSSAKFIHKIHFKVYNPSSNSIYLRLWFYKGTNYTDNYELADCWLDGGTGWYEFACTWEGGYIGRDIYNFQIADWNRSGVDLTYDDIWFD